MPLEMESVLASMLAGMPISILLEMMGVSAPFLATMLITMPLRWKLPALSNMLAGMPITVPLERKAVLVMNMH